MFNFDDNLKTLADKALKKAEGEFKYIDEVTEYNQQKMLKAFIDNGVSENIFAESTGYGYNDRGREIIDRVFAQAVDAEDAMVRHNFTCGTHTLAVALFGVLRPGDTMLSVSGKPYDTILPVIGISSKNESENMGSLKDYGVKYEQVDLTAVGRIDYAKIEEWL